MLDKNPDINSTELLKHKEDIKTPDIVLWPLYDTKIVERNDGWIIIKDTVTTTYYKINWNRINEGEFKIYQEKWLQWIFESRKNNVADKARQDQEGADDILKQLD